MPYFNFASEQKALPKAADAERAALGIEQWCEAADQAAEPSLADFARAYADDAEGKRLLEAVFGNSPFLSNAAIRDPGFTRNLFTDGPDTVYQMVMEDLAESCKQSLDTTAVGKLLRIAKWRMALTIAAADISGYWPLERVTEALSTFADRALDRAARHALQETEKAGAFKLSNPDDPVKGSGLIILGMGKLGAGELNYSSDIDLIVLYDQDRINTDEPDQLQKHMVRLTRLIVQLIDERTGDGYVFRTDLRLRPDPASTPIAISVAAAETYYETVGQNWERAAMIKARPVAGDLEAGSEFLSKMVPFIWRRNLDFAAIQDIHSIKRQINAKRGGSVITIDGHNIKLGRGGIREVEFFAQTQQLIWGGRDLDLRSIKTKDALRGLAEKKHITRETAEDLISAYRFLRQVEHRLQMIDDEQTHKLPESEEGLNRLAVFMGYQDGLSFSAGLLARLRLVESHYAFLFEDAPSLGADGDITGNLVFTGSDRDPETIKTLESLGFNNCPAIDTTIRNWHHGNIRATRSARARGLLTELVPVLLSALSKTANPDAAFLKFNDFLSRLPSGVQLFSMFHSNPPLLELVAEIMGGAPRLANHLSRNPALLESVLLEDFFDPLPPTDVLLGELNLQLDRADHLEDILDMSRRWANDRHFQNGILTLRNIIDSRQAGEAWSNIAEAVLKGLYTWIEAAYAENHGRFAGSGMVTLAMGKLGGREMTPDSDLDLIYIYSVPEGSEASDGAKPLVPSQYFARLSQRLINAVTVHTNEGVLYEVDMRLRPSGNAGPIASSLESFIQYHQDDAWTWEHLALTRAHVIAGPDALQRRVEEIIRETLCQPRDVGKLLADVASMRRRIDKEHGTDFIWAVKHFRGGLVDVEFIAQYLQLKYAQDHPQVLSPNTCQALENLIAAGIPEAESLKPLIRALELWQSLQMILRMAIDKDVLLSHHYDMPAGLQKTLVRTCRVDDFPAVETLIRERAAEVSKIYNAIIEEPAKKLNAGTGNNE